MKNAAMTPKRAAQVLTYRWLTIGGTSPWWMDCEEMTEILGDHNYNVTEKRRDEVIRHVEQMVSAVRARCAEALTKAGIDV